MGWRVVAVRPDRRAGALSPTAGGGEKERPEHRRSRGRAAGGAGQERDKEDKQVDQRPPHFPGVASANKPRRAIVEPMGENTGAYSQVIVQTGRRSATPRTSTTDALSCSRPRAGVP